VLAVYTVTSTDPDARAPRGALIVGADSRIPVERRSLRPHGPLFRRESGIWVPFTFVTPQDDHARRVKERQEDGQRRVIEPRLL
jgi:hypothetical protein